MKFVSSLQQYHTTGAFIAMLPRHTIIIDVAQRIHVVRAAAGGVTTRGVTIATVSGMTRMVVVKEKEAKVIGRLQVRGHKIRVIRIKRGVMGPATASGGVR